VNQDKTCITDLSTCAVSSTAGDCSAQDNGYYLYVNQDNQEKTLYYYNNSYGGCNESTQPELGFYWNGRLYNSLVQCDTAGCRRMDIPIESETPSCSHHPFQFVDTGYTIVFCDGETPRPISTIAASSEEILIKGPVDSGAAADPAMTNSKKYYVFSPNVDGSSSLLFNGNFEGKKVVEGIECTCSNGVCDCDSSIPDEPTNTCDPTTGTNCVQSLPECYSLDADKACQLSKTITISNDGFCYSDGIIYKTKERKCVRGTNDERLMLLKSSPFDPLFFQEVPYGTDDVLIYDAFKKQTDTQIIDKNYLILEKFTSLEGIEFKNRYFYVCGSDGLCKIKKDVTEGCYPGIVYTLSPSDNYYRQDKLFCCSSSSLDSCDKESYSDVEYYLDALESSTSSKLIKCDYSNGCNLVDSGATETKNTYFLSSYKLIQCTPEKCEFLPDDAINYNYFLNGIDPNISYKLIDCLNGYDGSRCGNSYDRINGYYIYNMNQIYTYENYDFIDITSTIGTTCQPGKLVKLNSSGQEKLYICIDDKIENALEVKENGGYHYVSEGFPGATGGAVFLIEEDKVLIRYGSFTNDVRHDDQIMKITTCNSRNGCVTEDAVTEKGYAYLDGTDLTRQKIIICTATGCSSSSAKPNTGYINAGVKSDNGQYQEIISCEISNQRLRCNSNSMTQNIAVVDGTSEIGDNLYENVIICSYETPCQLLNKGGISATTYKSVYFSKYSSLSFNDKLIRCTSSGCGYVIDMLPLLGYLDGKSINEDNKFTKMIGCDKYCVDSDSKIGPNLYRDLYECDGENACQKINYSELITPDKTYISFVNENFDDYLVICNSAGCSNIHSGVLSKNTYSYYIDSFRPGYILRCSYSGCSSKEGKIDNDYFTYGYYLNPLLDSYIQCDASECERINTIGSTCSSNIGKLIKISDEETSNIYLCVSENKNDAVKVNDNEELVVVSTGFPGSNNKNVMVKINHFSVTLIQDDVAFINKDKDGNPTNKVTACKTRDGITECKTETGTTKTGYAYIDATEKSPNNKKYYSKIIVCNGSQCDNESNYSQGYYINALNPSKLIKGNSYNGIYYELKDGEESYYYLDNTVKNEAGNLSNIISCAKGGSQAEELTCTSHPSDIDESKGISEIYYNSKDKLIKCTTTGCSYIDKKRGIYLTKSANTILLLKNRYSNVESITINENCATEDDLGNIIYTNNNIKLCKTPSADNPEWIELSLINDTYYLLSGSLSKKLFSYSREVLLEISKGSVIVVEDPSIGYYFNNDKKIYIKYDDNTYQDISQSLETTCSGKAGKLAEMGESSSKKVYLCLSDADNEAVELVNSDEHYMVNSGFPKVENVKAVVMIKNNFVTIYEGTFINKIDANNLSLEVTICENKNSFNKYKCENEVATKFDYYLDEANKILYHVKDGKMEIVENPAYGYYLNKNEVLTYGYRKRSSNDISYYTVEWGRKINKKGSLSFIVNYDRSSGNVKSAKIDQETNASYFVKDNNERVLSRDYLSDISIFGSLNNYLVKYWKLVAKEGSLTLDNKKYNKRYLYANQSFKILKDCNTNNSNDLVEFKKSTANQFDLKCDMKYPRDSCSFNNLNIIKNKLYYYNDEGLTELSDIGFYISYDDEFVYHCSSPDHCEYFNEVPTECPFKNYGIPWVEENRFELCTYYDYKNGLKEFNGMDSDGKAYVLKINTISNENLMKYYNFIPKDKNNELLLIKYTNTKYKSYTVIENKTDNDIYYCVTNTKIYAKVSDINFSNCFDFYYRCKISPGEKICTIITN